MNLFDDYVWHDREILLTDISPSLIAAKLEFASNEFVGDFSFLYNLEVHSFCHGAVEYMQVWATLLK